MISAKTREEKNYPLTGKREKIDNFDVTPVITYRNGKAINVTTYCVVNGYTLSTSDYSLDNEGLFTESHFDEHHGLFGKPRAVPKSRLEEMDSLNPGFIPITRVLGSSMESIENILREKRLSAYHVGTIA